MIKNIFILASSRSGTTLLNSILNKKQSVIGLNELHYFDEINKNPEKYLDSERIYNFSLKIFSRYRGDHWAKIINEDHTNSEKFFLTIKNKKLNGYDLYKEFTNYIGTKNRVNFVVDQTGKYLHFSNGINKNIKNSKFIYMFRDPRAVMLSQKFRWKQRFRGAKNIPLSESIRNFINYHPFTTAYLWNLENNTLNFSIEDIYFLSYEKLIINPKQEINSLCKFLNIKFEKSMLDIKQITSSHESDEVRKGFVIENINNWKKKLSLTEIWINQIINKKLIKKNKYVKLNVKPNFFVLTYFIIIFPIHLMFIFLLNSNNVINVFKK